MIDGVDRDPFQDRSSAFTLVNALKRFQGRLWITANWFFSMH